MGINSARNCKKKDKKRKPKKKKVTKELNGAPQVKGIVIEKSCEYSRPTYRGYGLRKCCTVKLISTGETVTAQVPYDGGLNFVDENDEVTLEGRGRPGHYVGDNPTRLRVCKVGHQSLDALWQRKRDKIVVQ